LKKAGQLRENWTGRSIDVVKYVYSFFRSMRGSHPLLEAKGLKASLTMYLLHHSLIHASNNRYLLPLRPPSTCPSQQSSSTRKKSTPANTTSTHTARSTASYRSIRHSNWKVCQSERTGRDQAGQVWHLARIIILVPEVGGELRFSSCPVAGLRMMRNRGSHSRRTSECFCWSTVQMF
jgi:hypothetical protein